MKEKKISKPERFYPGYNFGMKKCVVKDFAQEDELERFLLLLRRVEEAKGSIRKLSPGEGWSSEAKQHRVRIHECAAELRGLRKLWRTRHTDSFSDGLYKFTRRIHAYQISVPIGKVGLMNGWYSSNQRRALKKDSLLIWSGRDELGNCEFIVSDSSFIIKVNRGALLSDSIQEIKEQK